LVIPFINVKSLIAKSITTIKLIIVATNIIYLSERMIEELPLPSIKIIFVFGDAASSF
jgi:hypothetical protein